MPRCSVSAIGQQRTCAGHWRCGVEDKKIIEEITQTLLSLEEQGESILTTLPPKKVAERLFHSVLKAKFDEKFDEPIECTLPYLLDLTAKELTARFALESMRACEIVDRYYKQCLETRTMAEVAEIYWHETPHEIAGRAYYHVELGNSDDRDLAYLDWRQSRSNR